MTERGGGGVAPLIGLPPQQLSSHHATGSLWSHFRTMLDSQIDVAFEFHFHFYARRAVSCPRRVIANWTTELKRMTFFCFMFVSKEKHLSVVEDTKLNLRQFLCTDNGPKVPGGPSCDAPIKVAIISKDDSWQLYKIILSCHIKIVNTQIVPSDALN